MFYLLSVRPQYYTCIPRYYKLYDRSEHDDILHMELKQKLYHDITKHNFVK